MNFSSSTRAFAQPQSKGDEVLGLFPYFGSEAIGGIQTSARIAWSAVADGSRSATLIAYANGEASPSPANGTGTLIVRSKHEALRKAISRNWPQSLVFVWHLGLLKLLPFLRLSKAQIIVMLLGIEAWREYEGLSGKQLDRVDRFLSISEHTWARFVAANRRCERKPHQTLLLGCGEPLNIPSPPVSQQPVALMLSRLRKSEDYKGHRELIDAWPLVLDQQPAAELWIAGEGDLRPELEHRVRTEGLQNNIRFFGAVSEEKKLELLTHSRCLLMPSSAEGFGLVYLEAMRMGRPCLVSTLDAGREVVNPPEAGLAVNPDDGQALADAVCQLITVNDRWTAWSQRARRRYENNFTAAHFQQRLVTALFHPEGEINA
jgi:phosphatidylinositol alpha-1,6-mannosyltransferase